MSIMRCDLHSRHWDSDYLENCPLCEDAMTTKPATDWRAERSKFRAETRAAMKWWRSQHPEYVDAKVRDHGWYGRSVFATSNHETKFIESLSDILRAYRMRGEI